MKYFVFLRSNIKNYIDYNLILVLIMIIKKSSLASYKPGVSKKYLLFIAAFVWTFAGGMLLFRGFYFLSQSPESTWISFFVSLLAGFLFFGLVFSKVSLKHSLRIINLPDERPCVFSFFSWKSYLMMVVMISLGVALRVYGLVPIIRLAEFYITMGTPLLLSAFRFYYFGFNHNR